MANIEDTAQFQIQRFLVIIGFLLPWNRVPRRRAQAAFSHDMLPVAPEAESSSGRIVPPPFPEKAGGGSMFLGMERLSVHRIQSFLEFASVALFRFCKRFEPVGNFVKTFFAGRLRHARIHIGIFVGFTRNSRFQVI